MSDEKISSTAGNYWMELFILFGMRWLTFQSASRNKPINQSINQTIKQSIKQSKNVRANQSIDQSNHGWSVSDEYTTDRRKV